MKISRGYGVLALVLTALLWAGCGGGSSSGGGDEADDSTLTSADVQNIGAGLFGAQYGAMMESMNQLATESAKSFEVKEADAVKTTRSGTINVNEVYSCPVAGHITSVGDFNWSYSFPDYPATTPEASAWMRGDLMEQVSDPTNNLNDCEVGGGVILDGTIYSMFTYDWTLSGGAEAMLTTDGVMGFNRRGQYGGLVMIASDCDIFFTLTISVSAAGATSGSAYGTICGNSYSFSF